jgi:serine/threonine protein phosphatase PrpC
MEDKSVIIQDMAVSDSLDFSFFAVFDGHGGTECVRHVAEHFPNVLREYLLKCDFSVSENELFDNQENFYTYIERVLIEAIKEVDNMFFEEYSNYSLGSGCTGVIVLIIGDRVVCANIGDSRAILSRNKTPLCLSKDHKPETVEEKERIQAAGGTVEYNRVNGELATSRSFGDFKFKLAACMDQKMWDDIVTSKPEIRVHTIDYTQDEFIIIGCDGLYDNLSNQEIIDFVHDNISSMEIAHQDSQKVVQDLVQYSIKVNMEKTERCDNISAILIPLTRGVQSLEGRMDES